MNIELKKIKHSERLSRETFAFTAELHVDGKKIADVENNGSGGCNNIYPCIDGGYAFIEKLEEFCKTLPSVPSEYEEIGDLSMSLDFKISILVGEYLEAKDAAKFAKNLLKDMNKGILLKIPNGYEIATWKGHTIESLLKIEKGRSVIKAKISELKSQGEIILNTNIPQELFAE
jgi:hypothetical protein